MDPVMQLSMGSEFQAPLVSVDVKIEQGVSDDEAAAGRCGAKQEDNTLGLKVEIVKQEPDDVIWTGGVVSEKLLLTTERRNEDEASSHLKKCYSMDKKLKCGAKISVEEKSTIRNRKHTKLNKNKENSSISYKKCVCKDISDQRSNSRTMPRSYTCDTCQKCFKLKSTLNVHTRIHTGVKPFHCDVCKKCFPQKNDLTKHMRTHTGEKPFKCNTCEKSFSQKSVLIVHIRTHTGEKPYQCKVCRIYFRENSTFRNHVYTHSIKKPYQCNVCSKGFIRKFHLNRHSRRVHDINIQ